MSGDLLDKARKQAEKAGSSLRASALLRIARAESIGDTTQARLLLLEALEIIRSLPSPNREHHFEEARVVAAAVDPPLLSEIPANSSDMPEQHKAFQIIQTMLAHGHIDAAFEYVLSHEGLASFPFLMVGNVLQELDPQIPTSAARRVTLLRSAVEAWRQRSFGTHPHEGDNFVRLFGHSWRELPPEEALQVTRAIVVRATEEPDAGTSVGYPDGIHFTSSCQQTLFLILHVLRNLDPLLAQSLIDSHDQLFAAACRFPKGLQTIKEEAEAKSARRKAEGATLGGGFSFGGNPKDLPLQRRLMDAIRDGDFRPCIEDAIEKYREDTSAETRNYASKEYWPSTGVCRTLFYQAGKRLGHGAVRLLDQIPDDDLRLFASIELAAALAGVPAPSVTSRKQPNPPRFPVFAAAEL